MLSVKAIYENGKIFLSEPVELSEHTEVILTFLETQPDSPVAKSEIEDDVDYEKLREYKRFKARGNISIAEGGTEMTYPLNDYSAGGLSFFAERSFEEMGIITAKIRYQAAGEVLELDFEIRVMRCIDKGTTNLVGCQFLDIADEELWHTIMA